MGRDVFLLLLLWLLFLRTSLSLVPSADGYWRVQWLIVPKNTKWRRHPNCLIAFCATSTCFLKITPNFQLKHGLGRSNILLAAISMYLNVDMSLKLQIVLVYTLPMCEVSSV